MFLRAYEAKDVPAMVQIWNEVLEEGEAFPGKELLSLEEGEALFAAQDHAAVVEEDGEVAGLYILHPNNIGRCGHICNASYAVRSDK